jgi:transcriptional regulator with XRE-family HTH domain
MAIHRREKTIDDTIREELEDPEFRQGYAEAGEAWDLAIGLARLRQERGLTQAQLAEMVGTQQQNIARIENPAYSGHSLSLLRRIGRALGMVVRVQFIPSEQALREEGLGDAEEHRPMTYRRSPTTGRRSKKQPTLVREPPPDG